jgi:uncharacterized repeat protein (TIGR03803 family)
MRNTLVSLSTALSLAIVAVAPVESRSATLTTLVSFNGTNGTEPVAGLIADASGNLFGTTAQGGANTDGTVFELTGSGFVPPFAGFPGTVNCFGQSVARLLQRYGTLQAAASALGFSDTDALQDAIYEYCGPSVLGFPR